jgi:hypothetical protein
VPTRLIRKHSSMHSVVPHHFVDACKQQGRKCVSAVHRHACTSGLPEVSSSVKFIPERGGSVSESSELGSKSGAGGTRGPVR